MAVPRMAGIGAEPTAGNPALTGRSCPKSDLRAFVCFPWYKEACAQGADAIIMRRSTWVAVLFVVVAGWGIAALMAITPVLRVGSLSILII